MVTIGAGGHRKGLGWRLELAIFFVALALALDLLLGLWLSIPYWVSFLMACIATAWMAGRVAGWTAVVLSTLACDYFFDRPYYSFAVAREELPEFIAFAASMIAGNWFGNWRRRTETALLQAREKLKSRVEAAGMRLDQVNQALLAEMSQREQAEQRRRIAELRWQAVFEKAAIAMALTDEYGGIISANPRFLYLAGSCSPAQSSIGEGDDPLRQLLRGSITDLFAGERPSVEREIHLQAAAEGSVWLRLHIARVPGGPGFTPFAILFCEDISEQKLAAEALLTTRGELAHAARLTTVGELTASIAHELNQPLSAVVTNGGACLRWLSGPQPNLDEARTTVHWIMRDAKRASDVISRIRALMRKSEPLWGPVDFNQVVREGLDIMRNELEQKKIVVVTRLDEPLTVVQGERIQLQQVFLNLVLNAVEAMATVMDRPRRLTVKTTPRPGDTAGIMVEIRDNGPGISTADLDKLFTAFYTTKPTGTGLGLWISQSIIENHLGRLIAVPDPEQGVSFLIDLPQRTPQPDQSPLVVGEDFRV